MHLDNEDIDCMPQLGAVGMKKYRINRKVEVSGTDVWVRADTEQEYACKIAQLFGANPTAPSGEKHMFSDYAKNWFELFSKPNIEEATRVSYQQQIDSHLNPVLGEINVEDISLDCVQRLFNEQSGTLETKKKTRMVLNMILDMAVEDGLLSKNPLKSSRFKMSGEASTKTEPYTVDEMKLMVSNLDQITKQTDKSFLALISMHPLRLEEVLGLQWGDIDLDNMTIRVERAVTHPDRNQPIVKDLKTDASRRTIPLTDRAAQCLTKGQESDFVVSGPLLLSYSQVRRMCNRIAKEIGFSGKITPIRFRTTVLTDLYEQTKDIKLTQNMAGHTTAAMTLKHYVKGRASNEQAANALDSLYV